MAPLALEGKALATAAAVFLAASQKRPEHDAMDRVAEGS
jgi:hypothetical protein